VVESCEQVGYGPQGIGGTLMMLFLNNRLESSNATTPLLKSKAIELVKDEFSSAAERRHIHWL